MSHRHREVIVLELLQYQRYIHERKFVSLPFRKLGTGGGGRSSRRVSSSALEGGVRSVGWVDVELGAVTAVSGDVFSRSCTMRLKYSSNGHSIMLVFGFLN